MTIQIMASLNTSLRGRRSKGKGKGIRARDPRAPRALAHPNSLLTPATQAS